MDNSGFSMDPIQTINFFSIISYMNTLSNVFYSSKLIKTEERFQPIPIVNAYFNYLAVGDDEMTKKKNLTRRLLQNSDLYGREENEVLDIDYINATFDYIISNIVFSRYDNVHGYLATIANSSPNLTLSTLKQAIFDNLSNSRYLNEDGSFSYLNNLAIESVLKTLIYPLFPKPKEEMRIIDVDYIYAQAGLMLARTVIMNSTDSTFEDYIAIAQTIEMAALQNETDQLALRSFTLPALFFYAHKEKESFRKYKVVYLIRDQDFWFQAFQNLFSYLRDIFESLSRKELENSPVYQFSIAIRDFKNRTFIAREMLKKHCPGVPESNYESEIKNYKLCASFSYCFGDIIRHLPIIGLFFPSRLLPNIDDMYYSQIPAIVPKYHSYAKILIQKAYEDAQLKDVINSPDITVHLSGIEPQFECFAGETCLNYAEWPSNVHIFTLRNGSSDSHLVMINNQNDITIIKHEDDPQNFTKALALRVETIEIQASGSLLKSPSESFNDFTYNVANLLAKDFRKNLRNYGYDKTTGEKVLDFLLSFVPFYHCITNAWAGNSAEATLACLGDIMLFIPFGGQLASVGSKIGAIAAQRLVAGTGASIRTLAMKQVIRLSLQAGLKRVVAGSVNIVEKEILTKQTIKALSLGLIRSVDPGFEFIGRLSWRGGVQLSKLFGNVLKTLEKSVSISSKSPFLTKISSSLRRIRNPASKMYKIPSSSKSRCKRMPSTGSNPLPGACSSDSADSKVHPEQENPQEPVYVQVPGGYAELRQTVYSAFEKPVTVSRVSMFGNKYYKEVNTQTGQTEGFELKFNQNGFLEPVVMTQLGRKKGIPLVYHGRGKLKLEKKEYIKETVEFIYHNQPHLNILKEEARQEISHYILATEPASTPDTNQWISELGSSLRHDFDIDLENPDVSSEYLEQDLEQIQVNFVMNQYIGTGVPTYHDFALDFVNNNGRVRDVYKEWRVNDPQQLDTLLYNSKQVDHITYANKQEANSRLTTLYGENYKRKMGVILKQIIDDYDELQAKMFMKFEDFFTLDYFMKKQNYKLSTNSDIDRLVRKALFRLALRQGSHPSMRFPIRLHFRKAVDPSVYDSFWASKLRGDLYEFENFQPASITSRSARFLNKEAEEITKRDPKMKLLSFTIHLDSGYSIANLHKIFQKRKKLIMVLPNMKFRIGYMQNQKHISHVSLHNVPIKKEMWIRNLVRKIEALE